MIAISTIVFVLLVFYGSQYWPNMQADAKTFYILICLLALAWAIACWIEVQV